MLIKTSLYLIKLSIVISLLFPALFLSGCISKNNMPVKVNYFDLGEPQSIEVKGINLELVPFSNYSEVSSEMLYRLGETQVDLDPYNQWVEPPNILLTNFFKRAINLDYEKHPNNQEPLLMTLYVSVTAFDIDLKNDKVILGATYKIRYQGRVLMLQNRSFEQKFKEKTPSAFSSAMSIAAGEFLKQVCFQINELSAIAIKERNLQSKQAE